MRRFLARGGPAAPQMPRITARECPHDDGTENASDRFVCLWRSAESPIRRAVAGTRLPTPLPSA